jgi:hypothetical protein
MLHFDLILPVIRQPINLQLPALYSYPPLNIDYSPLHVFHSIDSEVDS